MLDSAEVNRQCVRDLWTLAREFRRKGQTGMAALFQERARFYVRQLRKARGA